MKLYLLRHGETDWNTLWKLQGRTDVSLNEKGIQQAEEAAERLKEIQFDAVFSSPLSRAVVTANTIAKPHNLKVITDERLIEMSFGTYEGLTPEDVKGDQNREALFKAPEKYVVTEGGESFEELDRRCREFLKFLKSTDYNSVLIVAHGALIRGLIRAIKNLPIEQFWESGVLGNCEEMEIYI